MDERAPRTPIAFNYWRCLPALLGVIAFVAVVFGSWQLFFRGNVVSYGDASRSYFKPATATEGDTIEICFDDIVWKRLCRSQLVTHFTPARGPRLDLLPYPINVPATAQRVPPKCREWKVPMLGPDREAGMAVVSGFAESECSPLDHWYPIYTPLPSLKLNVKKR